MTSRLNLLNIPLPPRERVSRLDWLREQTDERFTMRKMLCIQGVIERFKLPCQFSTESGGMSSLRIYPPQGSKNPVPLLVIHEAQVPRGGQPHPQHGTLGRAWLSRLAFNEENTDRCNQIGMSPGSLRPGSLHPGK